MLIRAMVAKVQKRTGVGRRKARQLISDGAERLDYACDTKDGHLSGAYTEEDIIDHAVICYEDEQDEKEELKSWDDEENKRG